MWYFYEKESVLFARIKNIQNLIVKIKIGFTLCKYIDVTQVDNVCSSNENSSYVIVWKVYAL